MYYRLARDRPPGLLPCLLIAVLSLTSCVVSPEAAGERTLVFSHTIDLSHTITQDMPHPPDAPVTQIIRSARNGSVQELRIGINSGTTLHLPQIQDGRQQTAETLSPRDLIVPAVVLDVRNAAQDNPSYRLSSQEVRDWEWQHGRIPAGSVVLLATGWDVRWSSPAAYLNLDDQQQPNVPAIGEEALLLLDERSIQGIGIDAPISDQQLTTTRRLAASWLLIEHLTSVEQLPPTGATLSIGLLKLQGGTASPARVLALVP